MFLPEGEYHEIGLLIAHLILCQNNKRVLNLGPSLPIDSLDVLSTYYSIDKILFFAVTRNSVASLNDTIIQKIFLQLKNKFFLNNVSIY